MSDLFERPPIATAAVSAVLPVFNAEAELEAEVKAWSAELAAGNRDYQVLLVDDGSTDRTRMRAEDLANQVPHVSVLSHPSRRGFGAALRTGLAAARHPLLLYAPAGGRYRPADLSLMFKWIDKVDLVGGYRAFSLPWGERQYRRAARMFFGVRLRDLGCFFVLARRSIFARIPVQADGPFAHTEVLAKANFLGCVIHEVPVHFQPAGNGECWYAPLTCREMVAQAWRVFNHPDFGPPVLPPELTGSSSSQLPSEST